MNAGQTRRALGVVSPLLLVSVGLLLSSALSCKDGTISPSPTMPSEFSVGTLPTGGEPITATIALRGLPVEEMVDAAGHIVITSGLENVAVGSYVLLEGGGAGVSHEAIIGYAWTLEGPGGSTAALDDPASRTPTFIPDVTGHYTVELTVANRQGILGPAASLTIHAATWVGASIIDGAAASPPQCIACHADLIETWSGTRHAISFERAVDGEISQYYLSHCIGCHTVGYDEAAVNGGFDDVAKEVGWTHPETLVEGNWENLVSNYPRLANLANTQCENCHGPGSEHSGRREGIAVSLRIDACAVCHDPLREFRTAQWARSGHADTSFAAATPGAVGDAHCARCHSGQGFIDDLDGKKVVGGGLQQVTCPVCHDPHDATHERQLRIFDTVVLPDDTQATDVGPSALCMTCHNGGVGPEQVHGDELILPHGNTASEMMVGTGGYDYGQAIEDSHISVIRGCVGCHMAPTPGMDDMGTPDDIGDDVPLLGHNQVGEHTFRMAWDGGTPDDPADDVENVTACTGCHEGLSSFNRKAAGDYDGDGKAEGIQDEVQGLLDLVRAEILAQGVQWQDEYPYWGTATTEAQKAAIYNWSFVTDDGSLGIHNTGRAVRLLQLTYRHLTGHDVPGATLR